jgi:hypothetical protein
MDEILFADEITVVCFLCGEPRMLLGMLISSGGMWCMRCEILMEDLSR